MEKQVMQRINFPIRTLAPSFLLLLLPPFAACKKTPIQPEMPEKPPALDLPAELNTNVLVPLTVGNWWKYETTGSTGHKDSIEWRIHADTLLSHGGENFIAAICGWYYPRAGISNDVRWIYINDGEGLNIVGGISSHDTVVTKYVERKYPINRSEAWEFQELQYDHYQRKFGFYDTLRVSCLATDQTFETPVGTFQCHVYYFKRSFEDVFAKRENFVYFAPGIGMVGWYEKNEGSETFQYKTALYACRVR